MSKIKSILAYTNPLAWIVGIPIISGVILGVFGYNIGKNIKQASRIISEEIEEN